MYSTMHKIELTIKMQKVISFRPKMCLLLVYFYKIELSSLGLILPTPMFCYIYFYT